MKIGLVASAVGHWKNPEKKRSQVNIFDAQFHAYRKKLPLEGSSLNFACGSIIQDLITYAAFGDNRLGGMVVAMGRISGLPIDLRRRPYNTLALLYECVI